MTKKKKTLIIRILLFGGTAISMFFVPWILVKAWILPLPDTVQEQVDEANSQVANVQGIKKFVILDKEWTDSSGELTPTLKLKRNVIAEMYNDEIESMYEGIE